MHHPSPPERDLFGRSPSRAHAAAAAVERSRDAIVETLLERAFRNTCPTLGAELAAQQYVDALHASFAESAWAPMVAFAGTLGSRGVHSPAVRDVVRLAPRVASEVLRETRLPLPRGCDPLGSEPLLDEVLRSLSTSTDPTETVDEVDVLIEDFVTQLNASDPATAEHSRAVSAWCARIAKRIGLNERETAYVVRAGLIHDIGKAKTPPEILNAPRKLDEREWAIMRDHVLEGERIVAGIAPLHDFVPALRWHHERYDGTGYPDRRGGGEIPHAVRIVTVADAFNAMIGRRPYRKPFSPLRALDELRTYRGTQFDPEIVGAMIDVVMQDRHENTASVA